MKIETRLIASAASRYQMKSMIARYFYSNLENFRIDDDGIIWKKKPNGTEAQLAGFRVIQKKNRFRFEAINN